MSLFNGKKLPTPQAEKLQAIWHISQAEENLEQRSKYLFAFDFGHHSRNWAKLKAEGVPESKWTAEYEELKQRFQPRNLDERLEAIQLLLSRHVLPCFENYGTADAVLELARNRSGKYQPVMISSALRNLACKQKP